MGRMKELLFKSYEHIQSVEIKEKYEQVIRCEDCGEVLGYAPFMREEHACVKCNEKRKCNG